MRQFFIRLGSFLCAVLVLVSLVPFSAFAVDPVSQAVMWNAMAQAVAGYGASQGVSMMFDGVDSSDTSQIGQNVHDLWEQYRSEAASSDVPTYATAAENFWAHAYTKIGNKLGINLTSTEVGYLDGFWNWLLSGPAEMVKVDNQYYEFSQNSMGQYDVVPVLVINASTSVPYIPNFASDKATFDASAPGSHRSSGSRVDKYFTTTEYPCALFFYTQSTGTSVALVFVSTHQSAICRNVYFYNKQYTVSSTAFSTNTILEYPVDGVTYYVNITSFTPGTIVADAPLYDTIYAGIDAWITAEGRSSVGVKPYIGSDAAAAGKVYIPNNDDVNYSPPPAAIPFDVNWDPSIFGDGLTMTDAQKEEMVGSLDGQIVDDGTLVLEGDDVQIDPEDRPSTDPGDYVVPGLSSVFPFCIPYDIYHFCQALAATPQAPHFTANLAFPEAIGGTQTIDLDFDTPTFNQLARILRLLELLAFIVGLALLTRSMFIRG